MLRTVSHTLAKAISGLAVLLAFGPLAAPAQASCGDHVRTDADLQKPAPMKHDGPAPCTGPLCGQRKEAPPHAPTGVPDSEDQRLGLPPRLAPSVSSSARGLPDDDFPILPAASSGIFHPPRA
ncbi:MAG: hypothetical protein K2W96_17940 [Gemmataceae bacterium]|nr:hypothetical protein [Gemmataceae bacterium]